MTPLSRLDFLRYCMTRGLDRIDNRFWATCAIGSYLRSKDINVTDGIRALVRDLVPEEHAPLVDDFMSSLPPGVLAGLDKGYYESYDEIVEVLTND